jgi:hypothetical protein
MTASYNNNNNNHQLRKKANEWGVFFNENPRQCPQTPEELANEAFQAIAASLYRKQYLDPAMVANARSKGMYTERPVRSPSKVGRIGIELEGVEHLFQSLVSRDSALRQISLLLATRLSSQKCWEEYEDMSPHNGNTENRPVVLVFNTVKEALLGRSEMKALQEMYHPTKKGLFNQIIIQTLSDMLPPQLFHHPEGHRRKHRWLQNLAVDPKSGIVLVCQPTDFSHVCTTGNSSGCSISKVFVPDRCPRFKSEWVSTS